MACVVRNVPRRWIVTLTDEADWIERRRFPRPSRARHPSSGRREGRRRAVRSRRCCCCRVRARSQQPCVTFASEFPFRCWDETLVPCMTSDCRPTPRSTDRRRISARPGASRTSKARTAAALRRRPSRSRRPRSSRFGVAEIRGWSSSTSCSRVRAARRSSGACRHPRRARGRTAAPMVRSTASRSWARRS